MKWMEALKELKKGNDILAVGNFGYLTVENGCDIVQIYQSGGKRTIGSFHDFEEQEYKIKEQLPSKTEKVPK